eukprot:COSAG05_NODE_3452_length_2053_cov_1.224156_2_plen_124_part_01
MGWAGLGWGLLALISLSCVWNMLYCVIRWRQHIMNERRRVEFAEQRRLEAAANGGIGIGNGDGHMVTTVGRVAGAEGYSGGAHASAQPSGGGLTAPVGVSTKTSRGEHTHYPPVLPAAVQSSPA